MRADATRPSSRPPCWNDVPVTTDGDLLLAVNEAINRAQALRAGSTVPTATPTEDAATLEPTADSDVTVEPTAETEATTQPTVEPTAAPTIQPTTEPTTAPTDAPVGTPES